MHLPRFPLVATLAAVSISAPFRAHSEPERPKELVTYTLEESLQTVTPNGERSESHSGPVSVAGDRVRWQLVGGRFPRARASVLLLDDRRLTFLDPKERDGATLPVSELESLFLAPASEAEASGVATGLRDLTEVIS